MPQINITVTRPEVAVATTQTGPTVTISETPVEITQNTSTIAVTSTPQTVTVNTAATTIQTTTLDEAFKGEWSNEETYHRGDLVRYEQGVYVYIDTTPRTTSAPDVDTDLWVLLFSESGLTGDQVTGINRAINLTTWDAETEYSIGDIVLLRQDYEIEVGVTVPYYTMYRLYHVSGSIGVNPYTHSNPPSLVEGVPDFNEDSAWQNLAGVRSINGFSGDVSLQEILDASSLNLNTTSFVQGSTDNHGSFESHADSAYFYGDAVYIGQNTSTADVGFLLSNEGGAGVVVIDHITGKLKFSNDLTNYYVLPTSTDDLAEGSTNLYYTTTRANSDFDTRLATKTTTNLTEGTNLYYTTTRANSDFDTRLATKTTTNLAEGTNKYYTDTRFDDRLATKTTTNLAEGTNLYYTDGRFDTRLATKDTDDLAEGSNLYYTTARQNTDFDARLATKTTTNLTEGTNLYYTSSRANSDFDTRLATKSTTNLAEGTNLYFTNARARGALSGSTGISYNNTTGAISIDDTVVATHTYVGTQIANLVDSSPSTLDTLNELAAALGDDPNFATTVSTSLGNKLNTADFTTTANTWYATSNPIQNNDTDDLDEGSTNLYYTELRATNNFDTNLSLADTDDLDEGTTNKYYTDGRARNAISGTGDISYDSNTGIISYTGTGGPSTTDDLTEGSTNLYYTDTRSRAAISASGSLSYNSSTGVISYSTPTTDGITEGSTNLYYTDGRSRGAISVTTTSQTAPFPSAILSYNSSTGMLTSRNPDASQVGGLINDVDLDQDDAGVYVKSLRDATRTKGAIEYTRNDSFTIPPALLTSVTGNNGIDIFSNADSSTNGYGAQCSLTTYQGDTAAGANSSASFQLRGAQGTNSSPSASASGDIMGSINFTGHATTGFTNYVASQNQGGGLVAFHPLQIQSQATEAPVESSFTVANAVQSGNYIRRLVITIGSVASSGSGVFTNTSADVRRNDVVQVTGTLTGTMSFPGYVSGNLYYVTAGANPTTTFTLSATAGGAPIATTSGTTTGLTFTRHRVEFNYATQTVSPFAPNSKVTIAGSTSGKFDGSGWAVFSNTTATAIGLYIATAGNQASAAGTIGLTNVTGAAGLRVRGFVTGQPLSNANRVEFINHNSATATYRTDALTLQRGSSTALLPGGDISYRRTFGCFHKVANVTAAAADTVYNFDWTTSVTAHVNTQGITISNTSRINIDNAGAYTAFLEMQIKNTVSANRVAWIWLAKNGTDISETRIKVEIKQGGGTDAYQLVSKQWLLENIADNDYIEVRFAVDNVSGISLEYEAAQTSPFAMPAQPSATITIIPVGA